MDLLEALRLISVTMSLDTWVVNWRTSENFSVMVLGGALPNTYNIHRLHIEIIHIIFEDLSEYDFNNKRNTMAATLPFNNNNNVLIICFMNMNRLDSVRVRSCRSCAGIALCPNFTYFILHARLAPCTIRK